MENNDAKYIKIAIVFAIFSFIIFCIGLITFAVVFRANSESTTETVTEESSDDEEQDKKEELANEETEEENPLESTILKPVSLNRSNYDEVITEYELGIPQITKLEDIENVHGISFPKVYVFDGEYNPSGVFEDVYNLNGMSYKIDKELSPVINEVVFSRSDAFCEVCEREMNLYSSYVQYTLDPEVEENPDDFKITFFKYTTYYNKSVPWILNMSFINNRANKELGEREDYYMLGYMNVENTDFKQMQIYFQMLDDDGVADKDTEFVIDYMIEDQFGMRFRHTVRGSHEFLTENYDYVSTMIDSFETTKEYYIFNPFSNEYETYGEYEARVNIETKKWISECNAENDGVCPQFLIDGITDLQNSTMIEFEKVAYGRWLNANK